MPRSLRCLTLLAGALLGGCGGAPTIADRVDVARTGWGIVDGQTVALEVTGRAGVRQPTAGDLDVFVEVPPQGELVFRVAGDPPADAFGIAVHTDDGPVPVTVRRDTDGAQRAALDGAVGRSVRIRLTNRSSGAITWEPLYVTGAFPPPAPTFAPAPRPAGKRYNVLLYVIDTLRADHLSCYGYDLRTSPRIDALATRGTRFTNTYAMSSSTWMSMSSLLASRHPAPLRSHLARDAAPHTLGEVFQEAGWATAGFHANLLLRPPLGYERGFETYEVPSIGTGPGAKPVRAEVLHDLALTWLRTRPREPFFMWIQTIDVHEYDPIPPFAGRFAPPGAVTTTSTLPDVPVNPFVKMQFMTKDRYDETLLYADHHLGLFFDTLEEMGVLDDTIVIVTSDHGEPLGEHGTLYHGHNVFEEVVHVPMIVLLPWEHEARVIDDLVSFLDLAPTITDLAGVPAPDSWDGRSLLAPRSTTEPVVAVGATNGKGSVNPSWFLRAGPWKVVMTRTSTQLFHLPTDPDEATDVAERYPVTAGHLSTLLVSRSPEFGAGWQTPPPWDTRLGEADQIRVRDALKALGYVE